MVALAALGAIGAGGQADAGSRLTGRYVFVGGEEERKARDRAIERVVSDMNVFVRAIARSRLKATNAIPAKVRITIREDRISVALDNRVYEAPADGTPVKVKGITGDEVELRYHLDDTVLGQQFVGDRGGRTNRFRPRGSRGMRIAVHVHSDQLPRDLRYQLTYGSSG